MAFLNISLVGDDGIVRPAIDKKLKVKVTGTGSLQGYGSARPCMSENFYSDEHTTYMGQSLAVVRAGYKAGDIDVEISGEGLETVHITVPVTEI
jgi:beta-galactosidase